MKAVERRRGRWRWKLAAVALCIAPALAAEHDEHPEESPEPKMSPGVKRVEHDPKVFRSQPVVGEAEAADAAGKSKRSGAYEMARQLETYGGKYPNKTQRPLIELGRPLYREGALDPGRRILGERNLSFWHFMAYGDWRTVAAYNDNRLKEQAVAATQLNLDLDLKLTSTERFHALMRPFDENGRISRLEFAGDNHEYIEELDGNPDTLFFEGDLGAIYSGAAGKRTDTDLPIALGLIPMLYQNGVWLEDAFIGAAFAVPAKHSRALDISNYDLSFFVGLDEVTQNAVLDRRGQTSQRTARIYGAAGFFEALEGYWEAGYGFTEDRQAGLDQDAHNITLAYSRRYGRWLTNSVRVIHNFGQRRPPVGPRTADGTLLLLENSLITRKPLTLVPYLNLFAGFDRPQSLARAGGAGGVLKNTGILFETDGQTGFPKLDDTAQDTYGAALGLEYLFDLDQQVVLEVSGLDVLGSDNRPRRPARAEQLGLGLRWQRPINNAMIIRADAMAADIRQDDNLSGARIEFRWKF